MSEIRQNIITKDWVIIATDRARRPHEFIKPENKKEKPEYSSICPFCPGNEHLSTKECLSVMNGPEWRVRVLPNKYPAISSEGARLQKTEGMHHIISGVGIHDVVVDHPRHDLHMALLENQDVYNIIKAYKLRYLQIAEDPRIETIVVFKNHGEGAGTSLEHQHSQIAAIPIVPYQFRTRISETVRHFDDTGNCIFCDVMEDEVNNGARVFMETPHFVTFIPYAALSPFHIWIFPKRHSSSFSDISEPEMHDLSYVLRITLAKLYNGLGNPDYNYTIRSTPLTEQNAKYFHWYLAIVPRVSRQAGFELGSGMYINTSLPEESADFLRSIKVD